MLRVVDGQSPKAKMAVFLERASGQDRTLDCVPYLASFSRRTGLVMLSTIALSMMPLMNRITATVETTKTT
jgi:hypothetical protein